MHLVFPSDEPLSSCASLDRVHLNFSELLGPHQRHGDIQCHLQGRGCGFDGMTGKLGTCQACCKPHQHSSSGMSLRTPERQWVLKCWLGEQIKSTEAWALGNSRVILIQPNLGNLVWESQVLPLSVGKDNGRSDGGRWDLCN